MLLRTLLIVLLSQLLILQTKAQGLEGIIEGSERINLSEISLRIRAIIRAYVKTNKSIVRN